MIHTVHGIRIQDLRACISDPKLYFILALFAGEASPPFFQFHSGWMYIFFILGLLFMIAQAEYTVKQPCVIVLLIYAIVILRSLFVRQDILISYILPNLITALLIITISVFFRSERDIKTMWKYLYWFAMLMSILGLAKFAMNPRERLAVFGGPNGYYKIALLFEVISYYLFIENNRKIHVLGMLVGLMLCFATGSKGGIASMIVILFLEVFYYILSTGNRRRPFANRLLQSLVIIVFGLAAFALLLSKSAGLANNLNRAVSFLTQGSVASFTSVSARTQLFRHGIGFFKESPVFGKGARYTYFYTNGVQPYSHNIFIEFLSEYGLLGTIPLALFMIRVFFRGLKYSRRNNELRLFFLAFLVYFSGSLFSGGILDSKTVFLFGMFVLIYRPDGDRGEAPLPMRL